MTTKDSSFNPPSINSMDQVNIPRRKLHSDLLDQYATKIEDEEEFVIEIRHPKLVRKSYAYEKRYFIPAPCVILRGKMWDSLYPKIKLQAKYVFIKEDMDLNKFPMEPLDITQSMTEKKFDDMKCAHYKGLYIGSNTQCDSLYIHINIFLANELLGAIRSKEIQVVTKPPKVKKIEENKWCIQSTSEVSLFNRIDSQTTSTRCLHVKDDRFCIDPTYWSAFEILWVNDENPDKFKRGLIHYGATIKLVHETDLAYKKLIIRKVEKHKVFLDAREPVYQLENCCLYVKDSDKEYLCVKDNKLSHFKAAVSKDNIGQEIINDSAIWTINGTETKEYRYKETYNWSVFQPTLFPYISGDVIEIAHSQTELSIQGEYFNKNTTVLLGKITCPIKQWNTQVIKCVIPPLTSHGHFEWDKNEMFLVPIKLGQGDGKIFSTDYNFTYEKKYWPGL